MKASMMGGAIAIAIALGGAVVVALDSRHAPGETTVSKPENAVAQSAAQNSAQNGAQADVQRLEAELAALRREFARRDAVPALAPAQHAAVVADEGDADPSVRAQEQAESERRFDDHVAQVALNFSSEMRDPQFATGAGETLRTALGNDELASMPVQNIECRSSTCRLEIADDGSGMVSQVLPMLAVKMAGTLPNVVAQRLEQPNGRATLVVFMSK